ncbi:PilZ domain-containing protein [Klenkia sp. PcliD-1-E]|uniref:PilZ domain-containing protein n=1 Tax=Klenkia sp. PcliD-1-E TaxID=2954492 RepID=UPI00209691CD|nr:PilZ domain-containing protein [Klenkia sp. PcliD-1-E]MCO7218828.1 PilZ domain-containing protein [Klenkia sp. PcliD-1-E]
MPDALPVGDRPPVGDQVEVVAVTGGTPGAARVATRVEDSSGAELVLAVGVDAAGRRVRLGLGAEVVVWWTVPDGTVRYRPHAVADVRGGSDPVWVLRPTDVASVGDRRATPRVEMEVPVGLLTPLGMVLGATTDISEGGLRALFAPAPTTGFGDATQPFAEVGELVTLALVLGGARTELRSRVLDVRRRPDGYRLLRARFEALPDDVRLQLRATTSQEIGRQVTAGRR